MHRVGGVGVALLNGGLILLTLRGDSGLDVSHGGRRLYLSLPQDKWQQTIKVRVQLMLGENSTSWVGMRERRWSRDKSWTDNNGAVEL